MSYKRMNKRSGEKKKGKNVGAMYDKDITL